MSPKNSAPARSLLPVTPTSLQARRVAWFTFPGMTPVVGQMCPLWALLSGVWAHLPTATTDKSAKGAGCFGAGAGNTPHSPRENRLKKL